MSVELDRIDNCPKGSPIDQARRVLSEATRDTFFLVTAERRGVRAHQHPGVRPQWRAFRKRLHFEDVQRGEADTPIRESVYESFLIDDRPSTDAADDDARLDSGKHFRADEVVCVRGAGKRDHDGINVGDGFLEVLQRDKFVDRFNGFTCPRCPPYFGAQGMESASALTSDAAKADDENGHLIELTHLPTLTPVPSVLISAQARQIFRSRHDAEDCKLRKRSAMNSRARGEENTVEVARRKLRGFHLATTTRRGCHDPSETRIRSNRARESRGVDVGDTEERVGRVDHLVEGALLLFRASVLGVSRPIGGPTHGVGKARVSHQFYPRLKALDKLAMLFRERHGDDRPELHFCIRRHYLSLRQDRARSLHARPVHHSESRSSLCFTCIMPSMTTLREGSALPPLSESTRLGVWGLGAMGTPMARRLLDARTGLTIHARRRRDELIEEGALWADTPRELAASCDALLVMLPDLPQLEEHLDGEDGLLAGVGPEGILLLIGSTSSPVAVQELASRLDEASSGTIRVVDCPVSGGEDGAKAGTLSIMLGGPPSDTALAAQLLTPCGTPVHLGPLGAGEVAKACNQMVVAATILALGEATELAARAGVEPATLWELLGRGYAGSRLLDSRRERLVEGDDSPSGIAEYMVKDLRFAADIAKATNTDPALLPALRDAFDEIVARGLGDRDITVTRRFTAVRSSDSTRS